MGGGAGPDAELSLLDMIGGGVGAPEFMLSPLVGGGGPDHLGLAFIGGGGGLLF